MRLFCLLLFTKSTNETNTQIHNYITWNKIKQNKTKQKKLEVLKQTNTISTKINLFIPKKAVMTQKRNSDEQNDKRNKVKKRGYISQDKHVSAQIDIYKKNSKKINLLFFQTRPHIYCNIIYLRFNKQSKLKA